MTNKTKKGLKNPRAKGSEFERDIAKLLSSWSGRGFERVPLSGGLRWKEDNNVTGDIVPPMELDFPVSIECKKVEEDWDFDRLLEGTSGIWKWWNQCCGDCDRVNKQPWLIFCKNFRKPQLMLKGAVFEAYASVCTSLNTKQHLYSRTCKGSVVIMKLNDFLDCVTLEQVLSVKTL